MADDIDRQIGELTAKVASLERWVSTISRDVREMRSTIDKAKGGWAVLLLLSGFAGTVGALIAKIVGWVAVR